MVRSEGWAQSAPDALPSHACADATEPSRKRLCPYLTCLSPALHATSPSERLLGKRRSSRQGPGVGTLTRVLPP